MASKGSGQGSGNRQSPQRASARSGAVILAETEGSALLDTPDCSAPASMTHGVAAEAPGQAMVPGVVPAGQGPLHADAARLPPALLMSLVAVALAPALFGSRDGVTIAFWCGWLALALLLVPGGAVTRQVLPWLAGITGLAALWLLVLHEQSAPAPFFAAPNPLWQQAGRLLGFDLPGSASVLRGEVFYAIGPPLVSLLAFLLGLLTGSDTARRDMLVRVLACSVAAYATFGLLSTMLAPAMLLWREREAYIGAVTGTFVNSNTAADYFGAGTLAWLAMLIWRRTRRTGLSGAWSWRWDSRDFPAIVAVLFCSFALILTRSRLGVGIAGLMLAVLYLRLDRRPGRMRAKLGLMALVALIPLILVGSGLFARIDFLGLAGGGRLDTYRSTLAMIMDHPWFGVGLGGFGAAFPAYRSDANLWWVWDTAHCTPLELAAEMGVPLALLTLVFWGALLIALVRRFLWAEERLAVIALPVVAAGALHSLFDFSLQTVGYAVPVMVVAGAALRVPSPAARSAA